MELTIYYSDLENLVFPLMERVAKSRGVPSAETGQMFSAACAGCDVELNTEHLQMQAVLQVHKMPATDACGRCGHGRIRVRLIGISPGEMSALRSDRFFQTLLDDD